MEPNTNDQPRRYDFDVNGGTDALIKFTHEVRDRLRQLDERGDGDDANERQNIFDSVKKLEKDLSEVRDMAKNGARNVPGGNGAGLGHLFLRGDPPKGMSRLHFNLIGNDPHDLCYASQFERSAYPGLGDASQRFARKFGISEEWIGKTYELQAINDMLLIADIAMCGRGDTQYANVSDSRTQRLKTLRLWKDYEALTQEFQRAGAMDTLAATEGGNWVPTILSSRLIELIQAELVVAGLFPGTPMPSPSFVLPVMGADVIAYKIGENTAETGQTAIPTHTFVTNKVTLNAVKLAARIVASSEVTEDTAVSMVPIILAQSSKSIARAIDDALLNGDTAGTHQDTDTAAAGATDRRTSWNGLRKLALAGAGAVDAGNAQVTAANLLAIKGAMNAWGARPSQGVWITGFKSIIELMQAVDGNGNEIFLTMDKYPNSVNVSGALGMVFGSPVVYSEFMREDLSATGVNTAPTDARGAILYANRESFTLGERRAVTLARSAERFIEFDQLVFVATWRGDFKPYYPAETGVGIHYNTR